MESCFSFELYETLFEDCLYKPTLIPQLMNLGILKEQVGICVISGVIYPIYTIDLSKIKQKQYNMQELVAA